MIKLNANAANTVYLTLTEKTTVNNPVYLFNVTTAEENKTVVNFIAADLATAAQQVRYNKFIITEVGDGGTPVAATGRIRIPINGTYYYRVYAQTSATNLDPAAATELVEEDYLMVYGNQQPGYTEYTGADTDYTQYQSNA